MSNSEFKQTKLLLCLFKGVGGGGAGGGWGGGGDGDYTWVDEKEKGIGWRA